MAGEEYSFTVFSKNAFYADLNARLVDLADVKSDLRVLDLACATGGVTRLILERINRTRDTVVIALDHSQISQIMLCSMFRAVLRMYRKWLKSQ